MEILKSFRKNEIMDKIYVVGWGSPRINDFQEYVVTEYPAEDEDIFDTHPHDTRVVCYSKQEADELAFKKNKAHFRRCIRIFNHQKTRAEEDLKRCNKILPALESRWEERYKK